VEGNRSSPQVLLGFGLAAGFAALMGIAAWAVADSAAVGLLLLVGAGGIWAGGFHLATRLREAEERTIRESAARAEAEATARAAPLQRELDALRERLAALHREIERVTVASFGNETAKAYTDALRTDLGATRSYSTAVKQTPWANWEVDYKGE